MPIKSRILLVIASSVFVSILTALLLLAQTRGDLSPIRKVLDPFPVFTDVAVDPASNIVAVSDENRFSLRTYERDADNQLVADPLTVISGPKSGIDFACGVAIDPVNKEIYAANNDTASNLVTYQYSDTGEVPPTRDLTTAPTGTWGIALDLQNNEVAVTIQHENKVQIYRRGASGEDKPLRIIQGPNAGLSDPHGIYIDPEHDEIFVANHDSYHEVQAGEENPNVAYADFAKGVETPRVARARVDLRLSKGKFVEPSIKIFSRTANGDAFPLRVIQGPKTELSLPMKVFVDEIHGEIFVANSGSSSILVFSRTADGNVAPVRKIEGPATALNKPVGLFVDVKNDEVWATNPGEHTATVYKRTAQGNAAPVRTLRGAPAGTPAPGIGNPGGIAYDPIRQQILVPN
jgi:DNA-binding beta-propeller fold protein YncE